MARDFPVRVRKSPRLGERYCVHKHVVAPTNYMRASMYTRSTAPLHVSVCVCGGGCKVQTHAALLGIPTNRADYIDDSEHTYTHTRCKNFRYIVAPPNPPTHTHAWHEIRSGSSGAAGGHTSAPAMRWYGYFNPDIGKENTYPKSQTTQRDCVEIYVAHDANNSFFVVRVMTRARAKVQPTNR